MTVKTRHVLVSVRESERVVAYPEVAFESTVPLKGHARVFLASRQIPNSLIDGGLVPTSRLVGRVLLAYRVLRRWLEGRTNRVRG